jgi:adhesin/invasin
MSRLYLLGFGSLLLAGCASEMTAPRVLSLRLVPPSFVSGLFTAGVATSPPAAPSTLSAGQAVVGKPLTVALQVVDQNNTPVPGIAVSWSALPGGGSLDSATSMSDTGGVVRVDWTLDTIVKLDSLQASLAPGNGVVVTAGGVHAAPVPAVKVSGDAQTVTLGSTTLPLVLRVTDRFGNAVGNAFIAWSVIAGDGALSQITTHTDATGSSQVTLAVGTMPGQGRVLATFGTLPAVTFAFKAQ